VEVRQQGLAVLPVEVVAGFCVGQADSGDFQELSTALFAEVVADLQERRDLAGEDDFGVEEGVGGVAHAYDLSVSATLRRVPVGDSRSRPGLAPRSRELARPDTCA
jgi:hypothetical protein